MKSPTMHKAVRNRSTTSPTGATKDYVGIGPGAHGRLTLDGGKKGTRGHRAPDIWLEHVDKDGHGVHPFETIGPAQRFAECLMMGLRLREGVRLDKLSQEAGQDWQTMLDRKRLQALIDENMLTLTQSRLVPTPDGLQRLNGILGYLL